MKSSTNGPALPRLAPLFAFLALLALLVACGEMPLAPESPAPESPAAPPTIGAFAAAPNAIAAGERTTLSWTGVSGDATLTLEPGARDVSGSGSLEVAPTETTEYTLTASNDAGSVSANATVTVTVAAEAPVASDVRRSTPADTPLALQFVARGAAEPTFVVVDPPAYGALGDLDPAAGTVTYIPQSGYDGPDGFTYAVSDGRYLSAAATVVIAVGVTNAAPVAQPQIVTGAEDGAFALELDVRDADSAELTVEILEEPEHGVLSGSGLELTYTPEADFFGEDRVTYRVGDGTDDSAPATVTITVEPVDDAPQLEPPDSVAGEAGSSVEVDLRTVFVDPDGGPDLIYNVSVSDPAVVAASVDGDVLTLELLAAGGASVGIFAFNQIAQLNATVGVTVTAPANAPLAATAPPVEP